VLAEADAEVDDPDRSPVNMSFALRGGGLGVSSPPSILEVYTFARLITIIRCSTGWTMTVTRNAAPFLSIDPRSMLPPDSCGTLESQQRQAEIRT
jgi:hypothetical protein